MIKGEIARHAPKEEQPLLLHCQSGMSSGSGTDALKKLGYSNVLNLGSYARMKEMLGIRQVPSLTSRVDTARLCFSL